MVITEYAASPGRRMVSVCRLAVRGDDALRAMAARGDADAFGAIYERHHQALYRYCYLILGHAEDGRDALHNTMAKAWEALRRAEPDVPLRPWLFRIAHNEAVSILRKRRPYGALDEAAIMIAGSLEETLEMRERLTALRADLAALTERQRGALLLRELCGLRHDEIAAVLAVSPASARQTIYEARLALIEAEAGRGMACGAIQRALSDGDGRARRARRIRAHLRACESCASFEAKIRQNPRDLAGLAPPLAPGASLGVFARLLPQAGTSGGISAVAAGSGTGPCAGVITAVAQLSSGLVAKVVVGSLVVAVGGVAAADRAVTAQERTTSLTSAGAHDIHVVGGTLYPTMNGWIGRVEHSSSHAVQTADRAPAAAPVAGAEQMQPPASDPGTDPIVPQTLPDGHDAVAVAPQLLTSAPPRPDASDASSVAPIDAPVAAPGKAPATHLPGAPGAPVTASPAVPWESSGQGSGVQPAQPAAGSAAAPQRHPASDGGPQADVASSEPASSSTPSGNEAGKAPSAPSSAVPAPRPEASDPAGEPSPGPASRDAHSAAQSPDPATHVAPAGPAPGAKTPDPPASLASRGPDPPTEPHGQRPEDKQDEGAQGPPAASDGQGPKTRDERSAQPEPAGQAHGQGPKGKDEQPEPPAPASSQGPPKGKDEQARQPEPLAPTSSQGPKGKDQQARQPEPPAPASSQGPKDTQGSGQQAPMAGPDGRRPSNDAAPAHQDPLAESHAPTPKEPAVPDPPAAPQTRAPNTAGSTEQKPPTQPPAQDSTSADNRASADPADRAATKPPRDQPKSDNPAGAVPSPAPAQTTPSEVTNTRIR